MSDREKLIELLREGIRADNEKKEAWILGGKVGEKPSVFENMADHLIAHGVTVQELDGCDYCRDDADGYRVAFGAFSLHNPFHNGEWEISTGHCKPRQIYFCPMCGRRLP